MLAHASHPFPQLAVPALAGADRVRNLSRPAPGQLSRDSLGVLPMLKIESSIEPRTQARLVKLIGEAGMSTVDDLEIALTRLVASRNPLVFIDLSGLTFLSSIGIGALVGFQRGVSRTGSHAIYCGARFAVQSSIAHARLDRFFEMYRTLDDAIAEAVATSRASDIQTTGLAVSSEPITE